MRCVSVWNLLNWISDIPWVRSCESELRWQCSD